MEKHKSLLVLVTLSEVVGCVRQLSQYDGDLALVDLDLFVVHCVEGVLVIAKTAAEVFLSEAFVGARYAGV